MRYFKVMNNDTNLGFFNSLEDAISECAWFDLAYGTDYPIDDAEITEFESDIVVDVKSSELFLAWGKSEIIVTYTGEEIQEIHNA